MEQLDEILTKLMDALTSLGLPTEEITAFFQGLSEQIGNIIGGIIGG